MVGPRPRVLLTPPLTIPCVELGLWKSIMLNKQKIRLFIALMFDGECGTTARFAKTNAKRDRQFTYSFSHYIFVTLCILFTWKNNNLHVFWVYLSNLIITITQSACVILYYYVFFVTIYRISPHYLLNDTNFLDFFCKFLPKRSFIHEEFDVLYTFYVNVHFRCHNIAKLEGSLQFLQRL
jgi:hypothetical protein